MIIDRKDLWVVEVGQGLIGGLRILNKRCPAESNMAESTRKA
jgi:hypothetical protein